MDRHPRRTVVPRNARTHGEDLVPSLVVFVPMNARTHGEDLVLKQKQIPVICQISSFGDLNL